MTFPIDYPCKKELIQFLGMSRESRNSLLALDLHGCWLSSFLGCYSTATAVIPDLEDDDSADDYYRADDLYAAITECQSLRDLDLSGNNIGSMISGMKGRTQEKEFKNLFISLTRLPHLCQLNLSHNNLDRLNAAGLKYLCQIFANCPSLEQVNLEGNGLTSEKIHLLQSVVGIINRRRAEIADGNRDRVRAVLFCWKFCGILAAEPMHTTISNLPRELIEEILVDSSLVKRQQDGTVRVSCAVPFTIKPQS